MLRLVGLVAILIWAMSLMAPPPAGGLRFRFKGKEYALPYPLRGQSLSFDSKGRRSNAQLDTISSCYKPYKHWVEIIRQDAKTQPYLGMALAFEFDSEAHTYPYRSARAVLQLKNFSWGGIEFDQRDTFNYTGILDEVSEDIQVEVDSFRHDTLYGRFSGLLLSGSGQMGILEEGRFLVKVYRK